MDAAIDQATTMKWSPQEARRQVRANPAMQCVTNSSGMCLGYLQANIVMLPSSLADDFKTFCYLNSAPCPLLYCSKPGEVGATLLTKDSDIRTDLTRYVITKCSKSGEQETTRAFELTDYPWDDIVTFYIGCSYSFQDALILGGVPIQNVDEERDVSMYKTNIHCVPVGPFFSNGIVVSMRPIKRELVEKVVVITAKYDAVHGAPIHIGDPSLIGIADINKPEFGDPSHFDGGLIPVYWACGHTTTETVRSAKPEICFTHDVPGTLFICDVKCEEYFETHRPSHGGEQPRVVTLQENPFLASVLGTNAFETIKQLEGMTARDSNSDLVKTALKISHASSIAIVTCVCLQDEAGEFLSALALAKACRALSKKVTLVASHSTVKPLSDVVSASIEAGILHGPVGVREFSTERGESRDKAALRFLYPEGVDDKPEFDALIAVKADCKQEHSTSMADPYCLSLIHAGVGQKIIATLEISGVTTCDVEHIQYSADSSVWGSWAVTMAVFVLQNCLHHSRYLRRGIGHHQAVSGQHMLTSVQQAREIIQLMTSRCLATDGFDFESIHVPKLKELYEIVMAETNN